MKKNIILESYNNLFLSKSNAKFDHTHIPREYIEQLVDDAIDSEFENGVITIAGYHLTPSECLKECDPIAYKEFFLNYCDSQDIEENDDGTFYDNTDDELSYDNTPASDLEKECCQCCGKEYCHQELNPENGYCFNCQQDEFINGPKEFRILPTDSADTRIIKESCMKRWKSIKGIK